MNMAEKQLVSGTPLSICLIVCLNCDGQYQQCSLMGLSPKRPDRYIDLRSDLWALATDLVDMLQPFEIVTTFFSCEENASLSTVLPVLLACLSLKALADNYALISRFK